MPKTSGPQIECRRCDTVIQSTHRHDFVECKCGSIAIDGGSDYTKIIGDFDLVRVPVDMQSAMFLTDDEYAVKYRGGN